MDFAHQASRLIIQCVLASCLSIPLFRLSFSIRETASFAFPIIAGAPSVVTPQILFILKPNLSMTCLIASNILTPAVSFSEAKFANSSVISKLELIPLTNTATLAVSVKSVLSSSAMERAQIAVHVFVMKA